MKCRALLTCDVGQRNNGARCRNQASSGPGRPALCWVHYQASINPTRLAPLKLVPCDRASAAKTALPNHQPETP